MNDFPQEITIDSLFDVFVERFALVHNLKAVYIGQMVVENIEAFKEDDYQPKRKAVGVGVPALVTEFRSELIERFKKIDIDYRVGSASGNEVEGNMLYVVLEIDTSHDYSIDDLYDENLFDIPYTLIEK